MRINFFDGIAANENKIVPRINYGFSFLDEMTGGISQDDFILIAAYSGQGKTSFAEMLATNFALQNKRVLFYSLESFNNEIAVRREFAEIRKQLFNKRSPLSTRFNMRSWRAGEYEKDQLYQLAKKEAHGKIIENTKMRNINIFYRDTSEFNIEHLQKSLQEVKFEKLVDVVIIDHLHFFDGYENQNENVKIKKLCNQIRDLGLLYNIPIVLFGHLRKREKKSDIKVPDMEEIHGSSDSYKQATTVVTFSHAFDRQSSTENSFPTYFRVCKDRFNGSLNRYAVCVNYSVIHNNYQRQYTLMDCKKFGTEVEVVENIPAWCRNHTHVI